MRRLVLVRHGESLWNAETRIQGQSCAGLSPTGHAQAAALAESLAMLYPDARLVTSDLQRSVETLAPLAALLGRLPEEDQRLRERSFGSWEGRLRDEVAMTDEPMWRRWLNGEDVVGEIGGESAQALSDRVMPVLEELVASTGEETIVAVTHGGPIWHGLHRLLDLPSATLGGVDNAAVTTLVRFGEATLLASWNETAHLPPELHTGRWGIGTTRRRQWSGNDGRPPQPDAPPVGR